jgi:hypothetical protein
MTTSELTEKITDTSNYGYDTIRDIVDYSETVFDAESSLISLRDSINKALSAINQIDPETELTKE